MAKETLFDWRAGNALLDCGDVEGFWRAYGDYLERVGVVSKARAVLNRAAKMTALVLEGAAEEFDEIIEGAPVDFGEAGLLPSDEEKWEERVRAFRERFNA